MREEFFGEKEYKEHKLKIHWGSPPDLSEYDKSMCSVYVIPKSEDNTLFTERTTISNDAKIIGINIIKRIFPKIENHEKFLMKKIIEYTYKNAKERINSKDFEKGKIYKNEISLENFKQWLDKIKG